MLEETPRRMTWTEIGVAALLGLTALATAWSAYRATVVRDDASSTSTHAIRVLNVGTSSLLHSDSLLIRNQELFLEYQRALAANDPQEAARIKHDLMRPELQRQVEWWVAQPHGEYPSPFVPQDPYYRPIYLIAGRQARTLSGDLFQESDRITDEANRYDLLTVILTCALFLLGIAAVMKTFRSRLMLVAVGTVFLVVIAGVLVWFGLRNVHFDCTQFLKDFENACN